MGSILQIAFRVMSPYLFTSSSSPCIPIMQSMHVKVYRQMHILLCDKSDNSCYFATLSNSGGGGTGIRCCCCCTFKSFTWHVPNPFWFVDKRTSFLFLNLLPLSFSQAYNITAHQNQGEFNLRLFYNFNYVNSTAPQMKIIILEAV